MSTDIKVVMDRIKNLKEFTIRRNVPEDFTLNGTIPYDLKLSANRILTVTLMAVDKDEAERRVSEFIESMRNYD